jgi:hypothetical protein
MAIEWDAVICAEAAFDLVKYLFRGITHGDERWRLLGSGFADGSISLSRRSEQVAIGDDREVIRRRRFREAWNPSVNVRPR